MSALLHYVSDMHRKMLLATLWNTGARTVSLTFRGNISDTYNSVWAEKGALTTSISDLFIIPVDDSYNSIPLNGEPVSLLLNPATHFYGLDVTWWLVGYSETGKAPEQYGAFTATAKYTVEVN